jgi:hypothetical protein
MKIEHGTVHIFLCLLFQAQCVRAAKLWIIFIKSKAQRYHQYSSTVKTNRNNTVHVGFSLPHSRVPTAAV